ncbi:alkaline phosphatase family protein [bacterium]|nr:alkaline phosphatase family protein [bacterium]
MNVLLIFVDGLGIGSANPEINPCIQKELFHLANWFDPDGNLVSSSGDILALDANLGVAGLPQSATGQTALLTGINAARHLGRHLQGYPNQMLRELLIASALPVRIKKAGLRPLFANAYRPEFFTLPEKLKWRLSATTVSNLAADLPFKTLEELQQGKAVYHDLTNGFLVQKGFGMPEITPEQAGMNLAEIVREHDFTLYEYFMTDKAGHSRQLMPARQILQQLERFINTLLNQLDTKQSLIILTSDHGNIEDLSVKSHTTHPVMTLIRGPDPCRRQFAGRSILDIAPFILSVLKADHD